MQYNKMTWADLIAKQGDLAETYYRQRQAHKLAKGREENRRAREKRAQEKKTITFKNFKIKTNLL